VFPHPNFDLKKAAEEYPMPCGKSRRISRRLDAATFLAEAGD